MMIDSLNLLVFEPAIVQKKFSVPADAYLNILHDTTAGPRCVTSAQDSIPGLLSDFLIAFARDCDLVRFLETIANYRRTCNGK